MSVVFPRDFGLFMVKRKDGAQIAPSLPFCLPLYFRGIVIRSKQRADHADQHADNEQGGGIKSEIVHGILSFAFCLMSFRRGLWKKVPDFEKNIFLHTGEDFFVDIRPRLCYHTQAASCRSTQEAEGAPLLRE